jgi:alkanesulfonate monooxygenase SsuD/methylene tetrahydromethanopterin reductase-like flavin-dependent oxidoreductase (luciferase family)
MSHVEVFDRALHEAALAEDLGFHDVWVTEHHFIPFGINPSALAAAAFILGRTSRIRVGTAVTLAPLYHPIHLAEQAAVLDQLSGGRFDFGIGRGGYLRDFEVFGVDTARWDTEVAATMRVLLDAWSGEVAAEGPHVAFAPVRITPETRTKPHPPLFVASASPETLDLAAARGIPLMHYFAAPLEARLKVESAYTERVARSGWSQPFPEHIHTLICAVTHDERAMRQRLNENLDYSYSTTGHTSHSAAKATAALAANRRTPAPSPASRRTAPSSAIRRK